MEEKYTSKLSPAVDFWAGVYLVVIAILSILGNAAVLAGAARRLSVLKAPELLTVNLAITDIGMALSMYPLSIASVFNHIWIGGDTSCLYYGLMGMIFSVTSIITLAVMGMVRYLVTGTPPRKGIMFQRRTICLMISGIWLYAGLWAAFPLLGWGSYGPEPFGLACSIDWTGYGESLNHASFITVLFVLCAFLPCLVILFTYFSIAWKLHRAYQSMKTNDFRCSSTEKRITFMAMMVSSGFLIAWTPYVAVSFWSMFNSQKQGQMAPSITLLPCLFAKSSTVYNPFIYFIFQRNSGPRLFHFHRLVFSCSNTDSSTDEGGKVEGKMTKSPCSSTFGTRTGEICVGLAGNQSGSEMMMLD